MNYRMPLSAGIVILALLAGSCRKHVGQQTEKDLERGEWKVAFFEEKGNNETHHFTDYVFDFTRDGEVTATKGNVTATGSWTIGLDDGVNKLYLDFGPPSPLNELNDDWIIKKESNTKVELEDVSGSSGSTAYLTFEKR
jgi:hypothetical protein